MSDDLNPMCAVCGSGQNSPIHWADSDGTHRFVKPSKAVPPVA